MNSDLSEAILAIENKDISLASKLLREILKKNPDSEDAWLLMYQIAETDRERRIYLNQVIRINPQNPDAQKGFEAIHSPRAGLVSQTSSSSQISVSGSSEMPSEHQVHASKDKSTLMIALVIGFGFILLITISAVLIPKIIQLFNNQSAPLHEIEVVTKIIDSDGGAEFKLSGKEFTIFPVMDDPLESPITNGLVKAFADSQNVTLYIQPTPNTGLIPEFVVIDERDLTAEIKIVLSNEPEITKFEQIMFDPDSLPEIAAFPVEQSGDKFLELAEDKDLVILVPQQYIGTEESISKGTIHFLESPIPGVVYVWFELNNSVSFSSGKLSKVRHAFVISTHTGYHIPTYVWKNLIHHFHVSSESMEWFYGFFGIEHSNPEIRSIIHEPRVYLSPTNAQSTTTPIITDESAKVNLESSLFTLSYDIEKVFYKILSLDGNEEYSLTIDVNNNDFYSELVASPDGSQIAFTKQESVRSRTTYLTILHIDGTQFEREIFSSGIGQLTWAPDSSHLAFYALPPEQEFPDLYIIENDTTDMKLISRTVDPGNRYIPTSLAWSPESDKLAYVSASQINIVFTDGSGSYVVTNDPTEKLHLSWSQDGDKLAYYSVPKEKLEENSDDQTNEEESYVELNVVDLFTKELIALNKITQGILYPPSWSPDNENIALILTSEDGNDDIFVMNTKLLSFTKLTNHPAVDDRPYWSPDGKQIAFRSGRDGNGEIYLINLDGTDLSQFTHNPGNDMPMGWNHFDPKSEKSQSAFQYDEKIVFESTREGNSEIYLIDSDGSNEMNLTNNDAWDIFPALSPDGSRVAFISDRDGDNNLYVINADGSDIIQLTENSEWIWPYETPAWSPDGEQIAIKGYLDGPALYIIDVDSKQITRLFDRQSQPNLDNFTNPTWSLDGKRLAFLSNVISGEIGDLYEINLDGTRVNKILENIPTDFDLSPDWKQIVVSVNSYEVGNNDPEIFVYNIESSNFVQMTNNNFGDYEPSWSPDGQRIAFRSEVDGYFWSIFLINPDGTNLEQLTTGYDDSNPDWGP